MTGTGRGTPYRPSFKVITNAGTGGGGVRALVYVDAFIPEAGETTFQILGGSGSAFDVPDPNAARRPWPGPGRARGSRECSPVPAVTSLAGGNRRNGTTRRSGPAQWDNATARTGRGGAGAKDVLPRAEAWLRENAPAITARLTQPG